MTAEYENRTDKLSAYKTAGFPQPMHLHRSLELVYVKSGVGQLGIEEENYTLQEGDLAVILPYVPHSCNNKFGECEFYIIMHQPELLGTHLQTVIQSRLANPIVCAENIHKDIYYAVQAIMGGEYDSPDVPAAFVSLIFARLFPFIELRQKTQTRLLGIMERVALYISEHFSKPLSLDILSKDLGINKGYLSAIFSKKFHTSFAKYVNGLRIECAKQMLRSCDMNILNICLECGFDNQRNFDRVFKSICGLTPSEYRITYFSNNK